MPLGIRIFLVYFLFVGLAGYFVLSTVMDEIRPGVRQSTEETLVDTANLLAEILRDPVRDGTLTQSNLPELLKAYGKRQPGAEIWGVRKTEVNHRIYVTDGTGRVLLDSTGQAVGQDYSGWNDVLLTLRGQYGARSTREDPADPDSSVMYVAAPIRADGKIIGVVSVAKPNRSLQPYIYRSQVRLAWLGAGLIVLGLLIGGLLSWWLSGSLRRLTRYAQAVSEGQRAELPSLSGGELTQLARAVERMRTELEGKAYVERYVHTLTHELKSPWRPSGAPPNCWRATCPPSSGSASSPTSPARARACSNSSNACCTWPRSSSARAWKSASACQWRRWWMSWCRLRRRASNRPACASKTPSATTWR